MKGLDWLQHPGQTRSGYISLRRGDVAGVVPKRWEVRRLLPLLQPCKTTNSLTPLRRQKPLFLLLALVLAIASFFVAGREARAEELPARETAQQNAVMIVNGTVAPSSGDAALLPNSEPPEAEPAPQWNAVVITNGEVGQYGPSSTWAAPVAEAASSPAPVPADYTWSTALLGSYDSYDAEVSLEAARAPEPVSAEPGPFGEGKPLPAAVAEGGPAPVPELEEGSPTVDVPMDVPIDLPIEQAFATTTPMNSPLMPLRALQPRLVPSLGPALSGVAPHFWSAGAPAWRNLPSGSHSSSPDQSEASTGVPPTPLEDAPLPSSPLSMPIGGSSFSLSGGGSQTGGGVAPLVLLGVLASVLALLRRDGRLSLISCDVPRPSSALLSPLERPG